MFPFRYKAICFFLLLSCSFSLSLANDQSESIETITVYGRKITPLEPEPELTASNVTVISSDQFQSHHQNVIDVIELAPSIQIQSTGELGSYSTINVRGAPSQQTQIYIDGILQPSVSGDSGFLQQISLQSIERIEIYPNGAPRQFAGATPGGAINIVRKKVRQNAATVTAELGSFEHRRLAASGSAYLNEFSAQGFVEWLDVKNNFTFNNNNGTPDYSGDDSEETRQNSEYQSLQASVTGTFETKHLSLYSTATGFESTKNLPTWQNLDTAEAYYEVEKLTLEAGSNFYDWLAGADTSIKVQSLQQSGHFADPASQIGLSANDSYDELESLVALHKTDLTTPLGLFNLSNEWRDESYALRDAFTGTTLNATRTQFNHGVGSEFFLTDLLSATTNVTHSTYRDEQDQQQLVDDYFSGSIGTRADLNNLTLKANILWSTRQPTLLEKFGSDGSFQPNENLENETATGYDLSGEYKHEFLNLQTSVFYRESENTIATTFNSQGIGQYINVGSAVFYGTEWLLSTSISHVGFSSLSKFQQSITSSQTTLYDNKQVPGYYPVSTRQAVTLQPVAAVLTEISYLFEQGLFYDRANSTLAPDKHQVDARIRWQYKNFTTSLSATNLLNRDHLDFSRKVMPRQKFILTLQYSPGDTQ